MLCHPTDADSTNETEGTAGRAERRHRGGPHRRATPTASATRRQRSAGGEDKSSARGASEIRSANRATKSAALTKSRRRKGQPKGGAHAAEPATLPVARNAGVDAVAAEASRERPPPGRIANQTTTRWSAKSMTV
jgi:hypothetical protein